MPELPEVDSLTRFLDEHVRGHTVEAVQLLSFAALKTFDPPLDAVRGARLAGCTRRGKFLALQAETLFLVAHLARAGWVRWRPGLEVGAGKLGRGPVALRLRLDDGNGMELTEQGTEKRLAIYVVRSLDDVPGIAGLGVDPLSDAFTAEALASVLRGESGQLKHALIDQRLIAGVGNAYSDEALHVARLSPFRRASSLDAAEVASLHTALLDVLRDAVERSSGLPLTGLKSEKRTGMRVHGRTGEACPVCGDTVREVAYATRSLQYCPTCQTGGRVLADRRLSRLLK
ncbi:MAG TPA: DNA-formamidopyrimidine glycosylase family protein [Candidatus Dormibacteraeota bacterium]|jgi:formamidopyrimidine-DNA glycosylase|nr:DNA-formamidopyrimidine glycosylase family protein [Candidatus Dormibacteraeota bacterium]